MKHQEKKPTNQDAAVAKLFRNGRSQAVRLPKEFRFEGEAVRIRRVSGGVLLEAINPQAKASSVDRWFAQLDELLCGKEFMPDGRQQPVMQDREFNF